MTYLSWFEKHAQKHKKIIDKLLTQNFTKEQIIDYFEFDNMVKNEKDFCLLYTEAKKCHDTPYLNCYFCACPYFRFADTGIKKVEEKTLYSLCAIDAKDGKTGIYGDAMHQDCSACLVPHTKQYVTKKFDLNWKNAMRECIIKE